jgi:hypothetical protein
MSGCGVIHLGEEGTLPIATIVAERLGSRSDGLVDDWETCKAAVLVLIVECEPDGGACTAARKFMRQLKRSDCFANYSASIKRRVAVLALATSVCANSVSSARQCHTSMPG